MRQSQKGQCHIIMLTDKQFESYFIFDKNEEPISTIEALAEDTFEKYFKGD